MILTLGHSVRPQEQTLALLQENRVALLVDVRAYPRSRRNPQYNADTFASAVEVRHIIGPGVTELHAYTRSAEVRGMRVTYPFSLEG